MINILIMVFKSQISYFQSQIKENSSSSVPSSSSGSLGSATSSLSSTSGATASLKTSKVVASLQKRNEAQASLFFFLEAARGFYTKLLEDIVIIYDFNELVNNAADNSKLTGSNFLLPFCQRFPSIFDKINSSNHSAKSSKNLVSIYFLKWHFLV